MCRTVQYSTVSNESRSALCSTASYSQKERKCPKKETTNSSTVQAIRVVEQYRLFRTVLCYCSVCAVTLQSNLLYLSSVLRSVLFYYSKNRLYSKGRRRYRAALYCTVTVSNVPCSALCSTVSYSTEEKRADVPKKVTITIPLQPYRQLVM